MKDNLHLAFGEIAACGVFVAFALLLIIGAVCIVGVLCLYEIYLLCQWISSQFAPRVHWSGVEK